MMSLFLSPTNLEPATTETSIGTNAIGFEAICSLYLLRAKGKGLFQNLAQCFETNQLDQDLQLRVARAI